MMENQNGVSVFVNVIEDVLVINNLPFVGVVICGNEKIVSPDP